MEQPHTLSASRPASQPTKLAQLVSLRVKQQEEFHKSGSIDDLNRLILSLREVADLTPKSDHEYLDRLCALAGSYLERHIMKRPKVSAWDLLRAEALLRTCVESTIEGHARRVVYHTDMAFTYHLLWGFRSRRIELHEPPRSDNPALKGAYGLEKGTASDMAKSWGEKAKYSIHHDAVYARIDLDMAVFHYKEALDLIPDDDPTLAELLTQIGTTLNDRFDTSGQTSDLNMALLCHEQSLHLTPLDAPNYSQKLTFMAITYIRSSHLLGGEDTRLKGLQMLMHAASSRHCSPHHRVNSGQLLTVLLGQDKDWNAAYKVASMCASLIPYLVHDLHGNDNKYRLLRNRMDFSSEAVAVALMVGKSTYESLTLGDLCRGIITGSIADTRTDIANLEATYPALASWYEEYRHRLVQPPGNVDGLPLREFFRRHSPVILSLERLSETEEKMNKLIRYSPGIPSLERQSETEDKMNKLIQDIRKLPGHESFLLPPSEHEVKAAAAEGPIVAINMSSFRCDALIVEEKGLTTLPLPDLTLARLNLHKKQGNAFDRKQSEWLWDVIARPVLDFLGFTAPPKDDQDWPRVWWILTGRLSMLPIHAAGYHEPGSTNAVMDRVISSYAPSVKALIRSRRSRSDAQRSSSQGTDGVLVGMAELPFALREIAMVERFMENAQMNVLKPRPFHDQVLSSLTNCDIFHFAGHGQAGADPMRGSLILRDRPLTVTTLLKSFSRERGPLLAYLSACATGRSEADNPDEDIHLISAFQVAGFQNVIGTLWNVQDEICLHVATLTYGRIQDKGMSNRSVPEALHFAIRSLRNQYILDGSAARQRILGRVGGEATRGDDQARDSRDVVACDDEEPMDWVPFVHYGL